jgi:hypothetical protein
VGKLANGFSDREVAVDLGPDYDMTEENPLEGTQVASVIFGEFKCLSNLKPVLWANYTVSPI